MSSLMKEGFLKLLIEKLSLSPLEHFTHGGAIVSTNCPIVFYDLVHERSCPADMHFMLSVSYSTPEGKITSIVFVLSIYFWRVI